MISSLPFYLCGLFGGFCLGLSWLYATTVPAAALGWISTIFFIPVLWADGGRSRRSVLLPLFIGGCVAQGIACYWLIYTVRHFGNFPAIAAFGLYLLFVATHGLQFVMAGAIALGLRRWRANWLFTPALAWLPAELFFPTLFPWMTGHTQIAFTTFAQGAALLGVPLLSFLIWWSSTGLWGIVRERRTRPSHLLPICLVGFVIIYGWWVVTTVSHAPRIRVALIQANISTEEKHDLKMIVTNETRYRELSARFAGSNTLVVWPESVLQRFIPEDPNPYLERVQDFPPLPGTTHIFGGLAFRDRETRFNSAFFVPTEGRIPLPYHKRILMPFGEYIPFSSWLPALQQLNKGAGGFTAGDKPQVYTIPVPTLADGEPINGNAAALSPLICYEDIVPSLARDAVQAGASVLVNLTNDAWFGNSAAPFQHHQIASFRAIETRRPLLRSTNTGLTAVVNHHGETIGSLPLFDEGVLERTITAPQETTYYVLFGYWPMRILALAGLTLALVGRKIFGYKS